MATNELLLHGGSVGKDSEKMATKTQSGVDTLAEVREILIENREALRGERLNETSKVFVDIMIAMCAGPSRADGWLRIVDQIRQLTKLMVSIDGADADRKLAEVLEQLEELKRTRAGTTELVQ